MVKLILIALPAPYLAEPAMNPPLSLAYIASYVQKLATVEAIDFATIPEDYNKTEYLRHIPLNGNIYVISCDIPQCKWLKQVGKYLKGFNPAATVITEGAYPRNLPIECIADCYMDIAMIGNKELAVQKLILGVPIEMISGLVYKKEGKYYRNGALQDIRIDTMPFPNRDIFDLSKYNSGIEGEKAIHIRTATGCPFHCYNCDKKTIGAVVRYRSVDSVLAEIDMLMAQGFRAFVICDSVFTLSLERLQKFCEGFKKRKIIWRCKTRTDLINWERLRRMKEAGLSNVIYDIDTAAVRILKTMNMASKKRTNTNAIKDAHLARIPVRCNLIYGWPGETGRILRQTVRMIANSFPDEIKFSVFYPIPGSKLWRVPKQFGLNIDRDKLKKQDYASIGLEGAKRINQNCVTIEGMNPEHYKDNLDYFLEKLDLACRRLPIKDTI